MKKQYVLFIVIIGVGYFLINVLKPNQWDIMVYSLLTFVFLLSSVQDVYKIIKTRKGIYVDGYIRQEEIAGESTESKRVIEFISPIDNKGYQIEDENGDENDLLTPSSKKVKVWVNIKDPQKSLVAKKIDGIVFLSLTGKMLFAVFCLVMVIVNW